MILSPPDTLPAVVVDIAISIIVEELRVYLGMRRDVSTADINAGFDALCGIVVGACYAAITEAERKLTLYGDLEAFELELKRFARAAGRKWADTMARDVTDLDRAELDCLVNVSLAAIAETSDEKELEVLSMQLFRAVNEIGAREKVA